MWFLIMSPPYCLQNEPIIMPLSHKELPTVYPQRTKPIGYIGPIGLSQKHRRRLVINIGGGKYLGHKYWGDKNLEGQKFWANLLSDKKS